MAGFMLEVLIVLTTWLAGSAVWLLMQVGMYLLVVKTHEAYKDHRDWAVVGLIAAPVFTFLFYFASKLWSDDLTWIEVVVWPLVVAWVFVVVLAGIHTAARIRGVLKPDTPA
jgi:hypothetical protein